LLTGKYRTSSAGRLTDWQRLVHTEDTDQKTRIVDEVLAIAAEIDVPPAHVAMAWLRALAAASTTSYVPIIGPRSLTQLEDYLAALDVALDAKHVARLDEVSAVPRGVPHEVGDSVHDSVLGGDASRFLPRRGVVV